MAKRTRMFNGSSKKATSLQPCKCTCTKENNTETDLPWVAKWGKLACKFELDESERKPSLVQASYGQTDSQVKASFQLAITCDSVWPGLKKTCCYHCRYIPQSTVPAFKTDVVEQLRELENVIGEGDRYLSNY